MRISLLFIIVLLPHIVLTQIQLSADSFIEKQVTTSGSKIYELDLSNLESELKITLYSKPKEIKAQYFGNDFLLFVYQIQIGTHYLTGYYKDLNGNWKKDYFNVKLDVVTGISSSIVKEARFLDESTLLLSKEFIKMGNGNKVLMERSMWRICRDGIYKYDLPEKILHGVLNRENAARPEY